MHNGLIYRSRSCQHPPQFRRDTCPDVISFAKNDLASGFNFDDAKVKGDLSIYDPDFIAKLSKCAGIRSEPRRRIDP